MPPVRMVVFVAGAEVATVCAAARTSTVNISEGSAAALAAGPAKNADTSQKMAQKDTEQQWAFLSLDERQSDSLLPQQMAALRAVQQQRRMLSHKTALLPRASCFPPSENNTLPDQVAAESGGNGTQKRKRSSLFAARRGDGMKSTEECPDSSATFVWSCAATEQREMDWVGVQKSKPALVLPSPGDKAAPPECAYVCVDTSGLYTVVTVDQLPPSEPPAAKKRGEGQKHTHKSAETVGTTGRWSEVSLMALLQRRLSAAQEAFPFERSSADLLTLSEVWVVPLADLSNEEPLIFPHPQCRSCVPLECFPRFVRVEGKGKGVSSAVTWPSSEKGPHERQTVCVRVARHASQVTLQLRQRAVASAASPSRKRGRDCADTDGALETNAAVGSVVDSSALRLCGVNGSAVVLRVVDASFLSHSCYYSRWCCVDDFDMTADVARLCGLPKPSVKDANSAVAFSSEGDTFHIFYSALRNATQRESERARRCWAAVWHGSVTPDPPVCSGSAADGAMATQLPSAVAHTGAGGPLSKQLLEVATTAAPQKAVTDVARGLFDDAASMAGAAGCATAARPADPCTEPCTWTVDELWGLWTRLGWTPPHSARPFFVRLEGVNPNCTAATPASTWMTTQTWLRLVVQCTQQLDRLFVAETVAKVRGHSLTETETQENDGGDAAQSVAPLDEETAQQQQQCQENPASLSFALSEEIEASHKGEVLSTLRRTFALQAALLRTGSPHPALTTPEDPCDEADGVASVMRLVGPAAQALALDMAATASGASPGMSLQRVLRQTAHHSFFFDPTWALNVLEPPALLLSATPSTTTVGAQAEEEEEGRLWGGVRGDVSVGASLDRDAAFAALLRQKEPTVAEASPVASAQLTQLFAAVADEEAEATCEVADAAEVRWRLLADWSLDASLQLESKCGPSPTRRKGSSNDNSTACPCCCCSAGRDAVRCYTVPGATAGASAMSDSLSQWVRRLVTDCLAGNGVSVTTVEPQHKAAMVVADTARETPATAGSDSACLHSDTVSELLTDTVVRVVQQNKRIVRRLLQLLEAYNATSLAGTEGTQKDNNSDSNDEEEDNGEGERLGEAEGLEGRAERRKRSSRMCSVWSCLRGGNSAACKEGDVDAAVSAAARELAVRQLRAFWSDVAAVARQGVLRHLETAVFPSSGQGCRTDGAAQYDDCSGRCPHEKNDAAASPSSPPAAAEGHTAANTELQREHPPEAAAVSALSEAAGGASDRDDAVRAGSSDMAAETKERRSTPLPRLSESAQSTTLPSAANCENSTPVYSSFQRTAAYDQVSQLDGPRAMQLYLQRVLSCSAQSTQSRPNAAAAGGLREGTNQTAESAEIQASHGRRRVVDCGSVAAASRDEPDGHSNDDVASFADLMKDTPWLHHALFLLSYGSAPTAGGPVHRNAAPPGAAVSASVSTTADEEGPDGEWEVSPQLAEFRAARAAKLTLDVWIGAALEVYAARWRNAAAECATVG